MGVWRGFEGGSYQEPAGFAAALDREGVKHCEGRVGS